MPKRRGVMKQPAEMVPNDLRGLLRKVSKAALADLAWDLAQANAGEGSEEAKKMVRSHLEIVLRVRKEAYNASKAPKTCPELGKELGRILGM